MTPMRINRAIEYKDDVFKFTMKSHLAISITDSDELVTALTKISEWIYQTSSYGNWMGNIQPCARKLMSNGKWNGWILKVARIDALHTLWNLLDDASKKVPANYLMWFKRTENASPYKYLIHHFGPFGLVQSKYFKTFLEVQQDQFLKDSKLNEFRSQFGPGASKDGKGGEKYSEKEVQAYLDNEYLSVSPDVTGYSLFQNYSEDDMKKFTLNCLKIVLAGDEYYKNIREMQDDNDGIEGIGGDNNDVNDDDDNDDDDNDDDDNDDEDADLSVFDIERYEQEKDFITYVCAEKILQCVLA